MKFQVTITPREARPYSNDPQKRMDIALRIQRRIEFMAIESGRSMPLVTVVAIPETVTPPPV